jgi:Mn2+/Fe2+ NRAMP family transporter
MRLDTQIGMAFSNLVALAIIMATAATLHAGGVTDIQTSTQAAEALRPVAGPFAFTLFALGIIGTGLLAVPVLAGSAAYAVGEASKWPVGLSRNPAKAKQFYTTLAIATMLGIALNFSPGLRLWPSESAGARPLDWISTAVRNTRWSSSVRGAAALGAPRRAAYAPD